MLGVLNSASVFIRLFLGPKKAYAPCIFSFFYIALVFFCSCSEDSDWEVDLFPVKEDLYAMYPNDPFHGDSISGHLATGVLMLVQPNGSYEISFDQDPNHEAPNMQLFRSYPSKNGNQYGLSKVKTLKPKNKEGRYVYSFVCEENESSVWALTLEEDGDYYRGKTPNVKFQGEGSYSDTLSLNLITVGLIDPIETSLGDYIGVDSLARLLIKAFRKSYTSITIDTIYVNHAEKHPTLGDKYPATKYWYAGRNSEDFSLSELGSWPGKGVTEALDIVLVHRIEELNVLGYGGLFAMNLKGGDGSTVVVGTNVFTATGVRSLDAEEIVNVTIHETGHFFGLRHTTSTMDDMNNYLDLSIVEDGFKDTPYCAELLMSGLYKTAGEGRFMSDYYLPYRKEFMLDARAYGIAFDPANCPDANLLMFPVSTPSDDKKFSKEQLKFLKKNLKLIPH